MTALEAWQPRPTLAIIQRPVLLGYGVRLTGPVLHRMQRTAEVRSLTDAELERGGKRIRRERRRRARALLLGALELRWALLQADPMCHGSLWRYGTPNDIPRGWAQIHRVKARAKRHY